MKEIMTICDKPESKVLVHCLGGVGRTATVLAAYLMWSTGVSRYEAKQPIVDNRRTILSQSQEDFLTTWYSECAEHSETKATKASASSIPKVDVKFPLLLMCVGYPVSGKSMFAETLAASNPEQFIRVNQDESGRKECEINVGKFVKLPDKTVILDRCNLTREERQEWLDLAHNKKAWVIFFSTPVEECKWRIVRRVGHPTIKAGRGGRILDTLKGTLEIPDLKFEQFEKMFEVSSFDASNALLNSWGCEEMPVSTIPEELGLLKFPRTRHLLNLGSATRDDLLIPPDDVKRIFLNREVLVEEKIDGANMGLSIVDCKIVAQNRSHYVSADYHVQFKHLDKWIHQHSPVLWEILESDRFILYGEWCYAKHSIPYSELSDWFTAFDLFDRLENKFWSRSRLEARLEGTGIALIPLICRRSFKNTEELRKLVQTKSRYYDGPVEGVVVRVCDSDDMFIEDRGKIVRSDFLSGDVHWMKYDCNPNGLARKVFT
jgi:atypical dual specificity phosphatase